MVFALTTPVLPAPPALRHVAPPRAPWPAHLTVLHDGSGGMLVDVGDLDGWGGGDLSGLEHVLAPLDVVRRADGHDVLLAACTDRLDTVVARRRAARPPLAAGEIVTIAVSVLRGFGELADAQRAGSHGSWWVTAEARPVFVIGDGPAAAEASTAVLRALVDATEDPPLRDAIAAALDAVADVRRFRTVADDLDDALLRSASATPIGRETPAPVDGPSARTTVTVTSSPGEPGVARRPLRDRVGDLVDGVRRSAGARVRPLRERMGGRRGPLLVAVGGAVGAVVLLMLVLPPDDDPGDRPPSSAPSVPSSAGATAPASAPRADPTSRATPMPDDPAALVRIASDLLSARTACGADRACLADVLEDPAASFPVGAVDLPAEGRSVTPLDSFGGVAVVRVEGADVGRPAQLAVIVAHDDRWLLRDVHDVAEQPS